MAERHDTFNKHWHIQYEKLVEFHRKNGHCIVPKRYEQDKYKALGRWVDAQRNCHHNNKMRQDRKDLLNELEFVWRVEVADKTDKNWLQQYEKLVEFKRKNGHCCVPKSYCQDKSLGRWVADQRTYHRHEKMKKYRKDLLDELEFVWRVEVAVKADKTWHQQYEKLVEFKRKNGHCIVPIRYSGQDKALERWIHKQRKLHTDKTIPLYRKNLLDELGFVWKADPLAARRSTTTDDVSGLVIGSFHALVIFSHFPSFYASCFV
jgi:uncharacterized protein YbgA (DUF1722 family)